MNDYLEKQLYPEARIIILQLLDEAPDGTSNVQMLTALLKDTATHLWLNQVEEQCAWMAERGLVTTNVVSGLTLVTITPKGSTLARGLAREKGVDRPRREV